MNKRKITNGVAALTSLLLIAVAFTLVARQMGWLQARGVNTAACFPGKWQELDSGDHSLNGELVSVSAVSSSDVWAVGYGSTSKPNSQNTAIIAHWNGARLRVVFTPPTGARQSYLTSVSAVSASNVWAVGRTDTGALIEHWDGARWIVVPSPLPSESAELSSVSAVSANDVWAVGDMITGQNLPYRQVSVILHWDGTNWSLVPGLSVGPNHSLTLTAVAAAGPQDVWVIGDSRPILANGSQGEDQGVIARWDGHEWSMATTPLTSKSVVLMGLVAFQQTVWVTARMISYSTNPDTSPVYTQTLAERWDGAHWSVVQTPGYMTGLVIAPKTGQVWVTGNFGPALASSWNGTAWSKPIVKPSLKQANWLPPVAPGSPVSVMSDHALWLAGETPWSKPYPAGSVNGSIGGNYPALMRYQLACS